MAMMAKMRSLAPAFILTVGVLFVLFMVISDSNVMSALGGRTNNIGSVNGQDITYKDFQARMEAERQVLQQQGKDAENENIDQLRDQVWNRMVNEILLTQQMEQMGIEVADEEIKDVILGDNPPEYLKQNFIDSAGNFNRQLYEQALFDPQNKEILIQVENRVRSELGFSKLQSILLASVTIGEDEVLRKFKDQNIFVNDAQYTLISRNLFPDSTVNLTEDDLKEYYNNNLDKYNRKPQRKLRFVLFKDEPSSTDSAIVFDNFNNIKSDFEKDTSDFKYYVGIYSTKPYSLDTLTISSFSPEGSQLIQTAKTGDIIGPVAAPDGINLYHLINVIPSGSELRRASHILINQKGNDEENLEEANKIYEQLINGGNFESIAKEKSGDPGSAAKGGDLGWFGKGRMIKEFEDAVFGGKVNELQKPVKTSFGYHIIKVTGISDKKYIVERIVNPVTESATTKDEKFNAAKDFAYLADKNDFEKEANLMNYTIQETGYFSEEATTIPGLGINKRAVEFAFENGVNSVSEVFKVQLGFFVAQITEIKDGGVIPFDEVKDQMKPAVLIEKKFQLAKALADEILSKINGDLSRVTEIDPRLTIKNTGRFNATTSIPQIGKDYAFIETALQLDPNKISEPVRSNAGYYLIKVISKTEFDSTSYAAQSSTIRNNLLQQKKQTVINEWLTALNTKSKIKDERYLFYGY